MAVNLADTAAKLGIKYFLISYVDLYGAMRAKLVPTAAINAMAKTGAGFAGFATWLDMTPADPDTFAVPDPASLIQLPWKKDVGWLASDLYMGGKIVEHAPRVVLKRQMEKAKAKGYVMKSGVECEFFVLTADGKSWADARDSAVKPCYDQSALMRQYELITEICDCMLSLGWGAYQNDHEDANGQFEMNWHYADALTTADRHAFFKYMVKSLSEKHGFRATFMPKPFSNLTGNGCHTHISMWDLAGKKNLFEPKGKDPDGISQLARNFMGGLIHHADALAALTNPTVNSYKRINAPRTVSGATWAPNSVTWTGNNRTHMIRVPEAGRFEIRLPDGAANPYLLQAGLLAAGLDGIAQKRDPGPRSDVNMYTEGHKVKASNKLPLNLLDALRAFEASKTLKEQLGSAFHASYVKLKNDDWDAYAAQLTPWELESTLDA